MVKLLERFNSSLRELFIQALKPMGLISLKYNQISHFVLADGFGCFEEIFFKKIYFNPEEVSCADVVIDLGAHQGTFTVYSILNMKPRSVLISVEPNPRAYDVLIKNIHLCKNVILRKGIKVYAINKAVYTCKKLAKLRLTRWSETSYLSDSGELDIQTITLEEIFSLFPYSKNSNVLLKMDIEGTERDLLTDARSLKFLRICKRIAIEPHGNLNEICEALERLGFRVDVHVITLEPELYRNWLGCRPRPYTSIVAIYRLIASSVAKPKIVIIKAVRE